MIEIDKELKPINFRQERFVMEYLATGNATRAADTAGYAHPNHQAFRLLLNDSVKAAIEAQRNRLMQDSEAKVARYVAALEKEASNSKNADGARIRSLELLLKVVGGFAPEKVEQTNYQAGFLADLDMEMDDFEEMQGDKVKDINDIH